MFVYIFVLVSEHQSQNWHKYFLYLLSLNFIKPEVKLYFSYLSSSKEGCLATSGCILKDNEEFVCFDMKYKTLRIRERKLIMNVVKKEVKREEIPL